MGESRFACTNPGCFFGIRFAIFVQGKPNP